LVVDTKPPRRLNLTDRGLEILAEVRAVSVERERRLLASFSERDADQLADWLHRLLDNTPELQNLAENLREFVTELDALRSERRSPRLARNTAER
jgi:hypothetical protein